MSLKTNKCICGSDCFADFSDTLSTDSMFEPSPPPPPPPPPVPVLVPLAPPAPAAPSKNNSLSSKSVKSMGYQDELKAVLTLYRDRKPKIDIKKTPDLFIQQTSNPAEIQTWLEAKGFDESAQRKLKISGHELFSLSKKQLESLIGKEEGRRLYSQILVQRNVSGFKTTTSSELQSILRKVREKAEVE